MTAKFRISRFLKRDLVVRVTAQNAKGILENSRRLFEFHPTGKVTDEGWYETTDKVLLESIKDITETLPFSPQAEQGLKQDGVDYEYSFCASCGGNRVKKLQYKLFEVVEDAS